MTFALTATASGKSAVLDWNIVTYQVSSGVYATCDMYRVVRSTGAGTTNFQLIAELGKNVTDFTDLQVDSGQTYVYMVRAYKGSKPNWTIVDKSDRKEVKIPFDLQITQAPTLSGTAGTGSVTLNWTSVTNADSYTLQRATGDGSFSDLTSGNVLTHTDSTVSNGTTYRYRVRGTNGGVVGPWSNERSLSPTATMPVAPTLTGIAGDGRCTLDWDAVADAGSYRVRRAKFNSSKQKWVWSNIATVTVTDYIDDLVDNGVTYKYAVRPVNTDGTLGQLSNTVTLTPEGSDGGPVPPPPPPPDEPPPPPPDTDPPAEAIVGYAKIAGVTGGTGGTTYTVTNYADFKTRVQQSGARIVKPSGNAIFDGGGETIDVTNDNLTIDGSNYTGSFKRMYLRIRASNVILRQLRLRPGDQVSSPDDADAMAINPTSTGSKYLVDHCSLLWGPDIGGPAFLNGIRDLTVQYCIMGAGLRLSSHSEGVEAQGGHSLGCNVTRLTGGTAGDRITLFRNLITSSEKRMPQLNGATNVDVVNNVIYNWGASSIHGNPGGANVEGNMLRPGPQTLSGAKLVFKSDTSGGDPSIHANSVWLGGTVAGGNNYCHGFTKADSVSSSARRTSRYGTISVEPAPATESLMRQVIESAGPTLTDSIDRRLKDHALNGTSDGYYNGAGKPAPNPTWPAPV